MSSCRTLPQVNERRNDPSVDGARIPPNKSAIAPCRSTSMSSTLSAPAAMPATRQGTFRFGFTPVRLAIVTCSRNPPGRSAPPAMTGTRPARDTRFGSSNDACVFRRIMRQLHLRGVLSAAVHGSFSNSHRPS